MNGVIEFVWDLAFLAQQHYTDRQMPHASQADLRRSAEGNVFLGSRPTEATYNTIVVRSTRKKRFYFFFYYNRIIIESFVVKTLKNEIVV